MAVDHKQLAAALREPEIAAMLEQNADGTYTKASRAAVFTALSARSTSVIGLLPISSFVEVLIDNGAFLKIGESQDPAAQKVALLMQKAAQYGIENTKLAEGETHRAYFDSLLAANVITAEEYQAVLNAATQTTKEFPGLKPGDIQNVLWEMNRGKY